MLFVRLKKLAKSGQKICGTEDSRGGEGGRVLQNRKLCGRYEKIVEKRK